MSSSESDEGPELVSFKSAKSAEEKEQELIKLQKANEKQQAKLKRQMKQELFLKQKTEKAARAEQHSSILDQLRTETALLTYSLPPTPLPTVPIQVTQSSKPKRKRKVYKDLNIEVTTVAELRTDRFSSAAAFKAKRLAKVARESIMMNSVHAEKLRAAGK